MLFQSPLFLLFFITTLLLVTVFRRRAQRHGILLAASYLFYAAWDTRFLSLLLISTVVDSSLSVTLGSSLTLKASRSQCSC